MLGYHSPNGKKTKVNGKHQGQEKNEILDLDFIWVEESQRSALPFFSFLFFPPHSLVLGSKQFMLLLEIPHRFWIRVLRRTWSKNADWFPHELRQVKKNGRLFRVTSSLTWCPDVWSQALGMVHFWWWLFSILAKGNNGLWQGGGLAPTLTWYHPNAAGTGCGSCGYITWWGCRSQTRPCAPDTPCTWGARSGPSRGGWRPTGKHLT